MKEEINIVYLMGAGRSGTTALATFLGNSKDILTVGEMHQFFEHIDENKSCSCGMSLSSCPFWSRVLKELPKDYIESSNEYRNFCKRFEYHSAISKYALNRFSQDDLKRYLLINETIFRAINNISKKRYILDSAKYIGRALGLRKSNNLNLKIIYVVRDVRGVINSFSKNVQSPRRPFSTIIYWLIINSIGEFIYRVSPRDTILKLKYEDLIENPIEEVNRVEEFLEVDLNIIKKKIENQESFEMPHIVGGNRLKVNREIKFKKDIDWKEKYNFFTRFFYFFLASPIMLINRFKV